MIGLCRSGFFGSSILGSLLSERIIIGRSLCQVTIQSGISHREHLTDLTQPKECLLAQKFIHLEIVGDQNNQIPPSRLSLAEVIASSQSYSALYRPSGRPTWEVMMSDISDCAWNTHVRPLQTCREPEAPSYPH